MSYFIIVLSFFSISFHQGYCQGFYKVIGSRAIRPNSEYHLAVSIESTSEPTPVTVTLQGTSYNGSFFNAEDIVVIPPFSSRICRLGIGHIEPGDYKVIVSGRGGIEFSSYYPLEYIPKSYSVLIQTDRAVYRPASKILFRALVLNSQLKPAGELENEPVLIYITDGEGNRVKEWKNLRATKGVHSDEFQLADNPVLGNWNISLMVQGQIYQKTIQVVEYILPKFVVDINAPRHVTFRDNIINIGIRTHYNYGKEVEGEATITVYPTIYSNVIQPIFQNPIRKVVAINGSMNVAFDIANELKLNDEYERNVIIDVTIEERLTGRRQNNSVEVHVHKYEYKMDLVKTADYFKPGLKYTAYVKVSKQDGSPLMDDQNQVTVRYGYSRVDEVYVIEKHKLDKDNGLIKLEFDTPKNVTNTTALRIEAEYEDLKERISPIPAAVSYTNTFLQATLITENPIINKDVEIVVNCTAPMKYLEYVLIGRGDVLLANTLQVFDKREFTFHFTATHSMVPISHLIVSYINDGGELIGDSLDIEIDGLLQNFVDIQVNTLATEPNLNVEFTIRAQPNSYIGLLAFDENALKLRPGFDLNHMMIENELKKYDLALESPFMSVLKDSKMKHFFWQPGSSNAHTAIYDSGADLLTNSHVNRFKPTLEDIYLRPIFYDTSTVKPDRGFGLPIHSVTRPPLAGPYAFSRIPKPVWNRPKVYLTEDIADTWLFANFSSGYEGKISFHRKVPKSLSTWVITGFSMDPIHGLGLVTTPKKIKVSKNFVVNLNLPYSVQRGEILAVSVYVYNYNNNDIRAEVTLHNPENLFEFAEVSNSINSTRKIESYRSKQINIKKNSGSNVSFMIMPLKHGTIEIKVTASSPRSQDVAIKNLLVVPEGETEYYTKTLLVDLRKIGKYQGQINFTLPANLVEGSQRIQVSTVGDLLGPTIMNLNHLIQLPTGCGEQNLIHIMANLIVLNHLKYTRQFNPTIQNVAIKSLEIAYQQQLNYKRADGSFSAFGMDKDSESSVWITAYTALALNQARSWIYVDENIIENCLDWLDKRQGRNGSFYETGSIIHREMQNRNGNSSALTAFVVMAFIDNQKYKYKFTNTINKGLDYLAQNIDESDTTYSIALCSYVLHLAKHASKQVALNLLDIRSKTNNEKKWWSNDVPTIKNEKNNPWKHRPNSIDIETTSYGLLSFLEGGLLEDAIPILDWLLDQQNDVGGFSSTQDTVAGLFGIYRLVQKFSTQSNMQINFSYKKNEFNKFSVNENNAIILQKMDLNKDVRQINVTAEGKGLALFRVSYSYNMNVTGPWPLFTLDPQVDKNSNQHHLQMSICTGFVSLNLSGVSESNMAVMEVNLPSGFTLDVDSLPSLEVSQNVQKVETANSLTKLILYFNNLTSTTEYCPTVSAYRTHKTAKQKQVAVIVYDYYDSSRRARQFYKGITSTLCDICVNENCGDICSSEGPRVGSYQDNSNNNTNSKGKGAINQRNLFLIILLSILFRTNII